MSITYPTLKVQCNFKYFVTSTKRTFCPEDRSQVMWPCDQFSASSHEKAILQTSPFSRTDTTAKKRQISLLSLHFSSKDFNCSSFDVLLIGVPTNWVHASRFLGVIFAVKYWLTLTLDLLLIWANFRRSYCDEKSQMKKKISLGTSNRWSPYTSQLLETVWPIVHIHYPRAMFLSSDISGR